MIYSYIILRSLLVSFIEDISFRREKGVDNDCSFYISINPLLLRCDYGLLLNRLGQLESWFDVDGRFHVVQVYLRIDLFVHYLFELEYHQYYLDVHCLQLNLE